MPLYPISTIAEFVGDTEHNIQEFLREDRIVYIVLPDGILIAFHAFQTLMPELYDMAADLDALYEAARDSKDPDDV